MTWEADKRFRFPLWTLSRLFSCRADPNCVWRFWLKLPRWSFRGCSIACPGSVDHGETLSKRSSVHIKNNFQCSKNVMSIYYSVHLDQSKAVLKYMSIVDSEKRLGNWKFSSKYVTGSSQEMKIVEKNEFLFSGANFWSSLATWN
jgi:hypothetical protein